MLNVSLLSQSRYIIRSVLEMCDQKKQVRHTHSGHSLCKLCNASVHAHTHTPLNGPFADPDTSSDVQLHIVQAHFRL